MLFFYDDSSSEDERIILNTIENRRLRDGSNILELPTSEFKKNFRLDQNAFKMVLETVNLKNNVRETGIPPMLQLAATLSIFGSGGYQVNVGCNKLIPMAQTTVSKVFRKTLEVLERDLCPRWIRIREENFGATRTYFFSKYKIPGVVGLVDGTHIPILKPKKDEHIFFNRKGFHSINTMILCNHSYEILAIDARNGGCAHDSAVWNKSSVQEYLRRKYNEDECGIRILGDSGYPLLPWLITPYRRAAEGSAEIRFNNIHAKARSQVERTIGMLKTRWRCLSSDRKLRYHPERVASIINVCAALHNICVRYNINIEPLQMRGEIEETPIDVAVGTTSNDQSIAKLIRDNIKNSL